MFTVFNNNCNDFLTNLTVHVVSLKYFKHLLLAILNHELPNI